MKLGLGSVSQFRDLRGAHGPGQWEKGLAWGGAAAGLGERFLPLFGEAADQPSSRRARTAKDWRKTNQVGQKPWGATHAVSASLLFLVILSAELMSSGSLLSTAMDFFVCCVRSWQCRE